MCVALLMVCVCVCGCGDGFGYVDRYIMGVCVLCVEPVLEIEQSYEEVHKRNIEASVMAIEEKEVPWYYDIMKFLELRTYPDSVDKREHCSTRMMATHPMWGITL